MSLDSRPNIHCRKFLLNWFACWVPASHRCYLRLRSIKLKQSAYSSLLSEETFVIHSLLCSLRAAQISLFPLLPYSQVERIINLSLSLKAWKFPHKRNLLKHMYANITFPLKHGNWINHTKLTQLSRWVPRKIIHRSCLLLKHQFYSF